MGDLCLEVQSVAPQVIIGEQIKSAAGDIIGLFLQEEIPPLVGLPLGSIDLITLRSLTTQRSYHFLEQSSYLHSFGQLAQ